MRLTREEIIDRCGFDPVGYTHLYTFHYYSRNNNTVDFYLLPREGRKSYEVVRACSSDFHCGGFFERGVTDLYYIKGEIDRPVPIMGSTTHFPSFCFNYDTKHVLLMHNKTQKLIVVSDYQRYYYFLDHSERDIRKGIRMYWGDE